MLNEHQAGAMLALQDKMNAKVNPTWLTAGYPFLRAVVVEGVEAMEHHGYKWWKAQAKDLPQLQMELVDIWHFTLSAVLVWNHGDQVEAARELMLHAASPNTRIKLDDQIYEITQLGTLDKLELLIGLAISRRINLALFAAIMADCGMTWEDLYRQYVGKNVLNFFRQDNGYKAGTYVKHWDGREDNEHLAEILAELDADVADFSAQVYASLGARYPQG